MSMAVRLLGATALDELYQYLDGQSLAPLSVINDPPVASASFNASCRKDVFTSDSCHKQPDRNRYIL